METKTDGDPQAPIQTFDWERTESVTEAVIRAVSAVSGQEPIEMDPLYETIDPDSLHALVESAQTPSAGDDFSIEFPYNGVRVRIDATGTGHVFLRG